VEVPLSETAFFDEMHSGGGVRAPYDRYSAWLHSVPVEALKQRHDQANSLFRTVGITFNVYGEEGGVERLIPFDIVPRILSAEEWGIVERGVIQRVDALNAFLHDVYNDQEILRSGKIPPELVLTNDAFRPEMLGLKLPQSVYAHVAGIDIVRIDAETFYVLEDNARTPSGVSYMLENRQAMMRLFPDLFGAYPVAPVTHYPELLLDTLRAVAPKGTDDPTVVLLTPGQYNSAYFEHAFLAQEMGIELVEGQDLFVDDGDVFMRTTRGPKRVHVIYRRIDDDFLDPLTFRRDSTLGVAGLMAASRLGRVTVCNAVGGGIADDKAIYAYMPEIIRFYLGQEPILKNVPTYTLRRKEDLDYTLAHLPELVVKEVHGSGGYGMLVGPAASKAEIEAFRAKIVAAPDGFIAQPTLALSTCPTFVEDGIAPRHVDLRPFVLSGKKTTVVPGGLTRVAMRQGSLVVNSSQGGGTKDTWVLEKPHARARR
jgi:uncharacterized circularly permuted ATP-grasp superfamily protein